MSRIATAVSLGEPVLLTGETGTGKTSVVTHMASLLRRPLISLNLSQQTESSDLLGGFKPVDARIPGSELQERFLELFRATFSAKKNAKFEEGVRKAVQEGKWKRAVGLWVESARMAKDRIQAKLSEDGLVLFHISVIRFLVLILQPSDWRPGKTSWTQIYRGNVGRRSSPLWRHQRLNGSLSNNRSSSSGYSMYRGRASLHLASWKDHW